LHTQWPGGREVGDPVYDQSLCSAGPMLADPAAMHELERTRLAELLAMVGPAVVVTHSAGGPGTFAVVTGEASVFLAFDRDLVACLRQGGCDAELVRLADHGVHGSGHGMMLERNHAEVLGVITDWVTRKLAR
jgi:hypothetical protein